MRKELRILLNRDDIEKNILDLKNEYEEGYFVNYGESLEWDDKPLTEEEYINNINTFLDDFRKSISNLNEIIDNFPKKKNGTFNRRNVVELASCNNCEYICEWHNTWIYRVVKVIAVDDTTLRIEFYKKVDTPA